MRWLIAAGVLLLTTHASGHDVYRSLENPRTHALYCNSKADDPFTGDCRPTLAKFRGDVVSYWVDERWWVDVPSDQVIFMSLPGEEGQVHPNIITPPEEGMVWAHFCGRQYSARPVHGPGTTSGWRVFCAFYPPSSM
jgi:hypothetical protein